jgi:hypothetical protein
VSRHPTVGDYAGHAWDRHRGARKRSSKETTTSHRCRECGTLRYLTALQLNRAARPRCLGCGGTLVETEAVLDRTRDRRRSRIVLEPATKCKTCGRGFALVDQLAAHLTLDADCRREYLREDYVIWAGIHRALAGTLQPERIGNLWAVVGLNADGGTITIMKGLLKREAEELIAKWETKS